jgi:predicted RNase H-like HicB family nuclease
MIVPAHPWRPMNWCKQTKYHNMPRRRRVRREKPGKREGVLSLDKLLNRITDDNRHNEISTLPVRLMQEEDPDLAAWHTHLSSKYANPLDLYRVLVRWSNADGAYLAEAPDLPGAIANGRTRADAVSALEVVMLEWLTTALDLGREIPSPYQGSNYDDLFN